MSSFSVIFNLSFKMLGPSLSLLFFLVAISCLHINESPVKCASNNTACDVHGDALINSFNRIETISDCRQLCYDDADCTFITYYNGNGFPFRNFCEIFKSCEKTLSCKECVSETKGCYNSCSKDIIGAIDENFLDLIPNTGTEVDCKEMCVKTRYCH